MSDDEDIFESAAYAPRLTQPGQYDTVNFEDDEDAQRDPADVEAEITAYLSSKKASAKAHGVRNDTAALERVRSELRAQGGWSSLPWVETLVLTTNAPVAAGIKDIEDDFQRELAFYQATLASTNIGLQQLEQAGVKWRRPDDYFAEMLKSDAHMERVRKSLIEQKEREEQREKIRQNRQAKKFGKQVQVAKQKERSAQKKANIDAVKTLRRKHKMDGKPIDDAEIESVVSPGKRKLDGANAKGAKRQARDQKFGFGGKKRHLKDNTPQSSADFSSFSSVHNKRLPSDVGRRVGVRTAGQPARRASRAKSPAGNKRPGKRAREHRAARGRK